MYEFSLPLHQNEPPLVDPLAVTEPQEGWCKAVPDPDEQVTVQRKAVDHVHIQGYLIYIEWIEDHQLVFDQVILHADVIIPDPIVPYRSVTDAVRAKKWLAFLDGNIIIDVLHATVQPHLGGDIRMVLTEGGDICRIGERTIFQGRLRFHPHGSQDG